MSWMKNKVFLAGAMILAASSLLVYGYTYNKTLEEKEDKKK